MATVDQAARWNGPGGQGWVASQAMLEELFRPFEQVLIEGLPAGEVLDVGCGTGATTAAIARTPGRRAVGIDVSTPMITAARRREGDGIAFIEADAQVYDFPPASFDAIVSRFGVMFFPEPVRAFANLRRASKPLAGVRLVVWRDIDDNPFMTTAERAAGPLLPELPPRRDGPGQFGLADPSLVREILAESGWSDVELEPLDVELTMPESELTGYFTRLGPVGQILADVEEPRRSRIIETVRAAFDPFISGTNVRFTASCWLITARNAG
ncbi:class I SAM-dependent methyltransferase [Paractinoplanes atraurantiacus]|uniref:Methyltransferase domain-containing protein n=1 Tax=Paractinoplanes atraurantiacus TaxID=1036182 RepID=A0A285KQ83_9ACTN|nr:class I SAM-dependent methyltransferase [Actinoplanes atraurantiacus]SNY74775.1 Methyltransferase domain-containing protein [Actinoplanes atraurantiacus]